MDAHILSEQEIGETVEDAAASKKFKGICRLELRLFQLNIYENTKNGRITRYRARVYPQSTVLWAISTRTTSNPQYVTPSIDLHIEISWWRS